jgi:hypothetical protein
VIGEPGGVPLDHDAVHHDHEEHRCHERAGKGPAAVLKTLRREDRREQQKG